MELTLYEYEIPLIKPLWISTRKGLYLKLQCPNESSPRWGEIAPLPRFSKETLDQVKQQTFSLIQELQSTPYLNLDRSHLYPSVRCGFDMIFFPQSPINAKITLAGLIGPNQPLPTSPSYSTYKLKVDASTIDSDFNRIQHLASFSKVRVDPNQSYSHEQISSLWNKITSHNLVNAIDFIEEPCKSYSNEINFPFALDESLQLPNPTIPKGTQALVLKPMLLGGIEKTVAWIHFALKNNLKWILSSAFESALATHYYSQLIPQFHNPQPAGFDPYHWIDPQVHTYPLQIEMGNLILSDQNNPPRINDPWLKKLYTTTLPTIAHSHS